MEERGSFKCWWDEKEGIIKNKAIGYYDEEAAKGQEVELLKLASKIPGGALLLSDMTKTGKASVEARKVLLRLLRNKAFKKQAYFGVNMFVKSVLVFIIKIAGLKNIGMFKNEAEALKWLKK
ncbi:MAG: hypothetical protein ABIA67_07030 [Candidatus Margulisiibacteriota bacterium]